MSNYRTVYTGLGMALVSALVCVMGSGCVEARESVDEEAINEVNQAEVTIWKTVSCTMSSPGPTGRRWGTLAVGDDLSICYRFADTTRVDVPPANAMRCHDIGSRLKCAEIVDL